MTSSLVILMFAVFTVCAVIVGIFLREWIRTHGWDKGAKWLVTWALLLFSAAVFWVVDRPTVQTADIEPIPTTDPLWQWDEQIVQLEQTAHAAISTAYWFVWQVACPTATPTSAPDLTLTRWPWTPTPTETSTPTRTPTVTRSPTFAMPTETPTATLVALKETCERCVSSSECQQDLSCYQCGIDKVWRCVPRAAPNGGCITCWNLGK
jgi:hypothetical protein